MKPKWLIEIGCFPEDETPFLNALDRNGLEYKTVQWKPFDIDEYLEMFDPDDCVIFYGSLGLAKKLIKKSKWIPGVYCDLKKYECTSYYPALGKYLLNGDYVILPYGDLVRQKEFLYHHLGQARALFIRPNVGDKLFTGQVVYKEEYENTIERFNFNQIKPEELIVVAEPQNVAFEWRFVVVKGVIVAGSQYREHERVAVDAGYPPEALEFAETIKSLYNPDIAWVIDVCQTRLGEYRLMEVGCFSCAGLYKCNREAVTQAVSAAALEEWQSYQLP